MTEDTCDRQQRCMSCLREGYWASPLELILVSTQGLRAKKYGALRRTDIQLRRRVRVCRLCKTYLSSRQAKWSDCWPCVLSHYVQGTGSAGVELWSVLPLNIRLWWRHLREVYGTAAPVVDVTIRMENFHRDVGSNSIGLLMRGLNAEPVRSVRCPYGCWIFVDEAKLISYAHIIQGIDPEFRSCNANFDKFLSRRRADWLKVIRFFEWEIRSSCCRTDAEGLSVLLCERHSRGSVGEYVHLPQNPISHFPPVEGETLGVAVAASHVAKAGRATYSGYTYKMLQATAGFKGVSSFMLKQNGEWDVGGLYKYKHDNLVFWEREDIRELTRQRYRLGEVPFTAKRELEAGPLYSADSLSESRASSLWVPSEQVVRCGVTNEGVRCKVSNVILRDVQDDADANADDGNERVTEVVIPGEIYNLRSTNRWNEYPKITPKWCRGGSRALWAIIMVLINANTVWRQVVKRCATDIPNWRTYIVWITAVKVLGVKRKSYSQGLQRRVLNHLRRVEKVNQLVDLYCRPVGYIGPIPFEAACGEFFADVPGIDVYHVRERNQRGWNEIVNRSVEASILILRTSAGVGSRSRTVIPDVEFSTVDGGRWSLRFVFGNSMDIVRAGEAAWSIDQRWTAAKFQRDGIPTEHLRSWSILVYIKTNGCCESDAKKKMLSFIGGQGTVQCEICERYLIREVHGTCQKCSVSGCKRRMYFSCPTDGCVCGICREHAREFFSSPETQVSLRPQAAESGVTRSRQLSPESSSDDECISRWNGVQEMGPTQVTGKDVVGGHVIINGLLHSLRRGNHTMPLNTAEQRFLQQMVSRSPNIMLSLELPEATLFPTLFFQGTNDNGVEGALPLSAFGQKDSCESVGLASATDQLLTRLADGSLQTSRSLDYLSYVFGILFNKRLAHTDSRVVMRRGYYSLTRGATAIDRDECPLPFEELDSRQQVRRLAASLKADPTCTKMFLTLTCNQQKHFGIAPLRRAITDHVAHLSPSESTAVQEGTMVDICLAWSRVLKYFVRYISRSEELLGPVKAVFARVEFQDAAGNLPHLHLLAKLDDSVTDAEARARIECAESRIHDIGGGLTVSAEDSERLVEEGLIERVNDWMTYYTDFEKIQSHSCERADFRCHKRRKVVVDEENNEERIVSECRVPHYRPAYNDSFDVMNAPHSAEALQLLLRLGLGRRLAGTGEIVVGEELIAGRHQYSSDLGTHISPTIPRLFLSTRSSSNTQVCDKYFNSRYLSKYLCGAEERASADLRVTCDGSLRVDVDRIRNRKLGVDHMRESRLGRKRYREEYRLVASPESCWWVYDLPYILSDEEFLTCPTRPLSQRSGRLRNGRPGGSSDNVDGVDHRHTIEGLTDDRKYTENQRLIYRSVMLSECTVDNLVAFELRPPELRFVDNPIRFLENFTWRKSHNGQQGISEDLKASPWTDCLNRQWRVRKSAVKGIQLCAIESDDSLGYDVYRSILEHLDSVEVERELYERFVDDSASGSKRCIVVTSLPRPSNVLGFLVHILLSRGRFTTELDLYAAGSMTEAFRIAGLIPRDRNVEPEDVDALLQAYVVDELVFNPVGGTKGFDNCLVVADKVLRGLLLEGCIAYEELPIAEEEELIIDGMADAREVHEAGRERIIQCMTGELGDAVPTAEQLRGATLSNPLTWKPKLRATAEQTAASRVEQQEILDNIIERCNCWLRGGHTPLILIEGMPGCGKSHLAKFLAVYMLSRGMSLIMTALASERAMSLGGCHIHHEFGLPVSNEWDQSTSEQHAFNAYRKLASRPAQLHRLQRAHALIIDEIFTLNAKTYHTIDILLRRIRGNAAPCGGLLLVATGDYRQLPPVSGTRLTVDPCLMTNFVVYHLQNLVRAAADGPLQRVLTLMGKPVLSEAEIDEICGILSENCRWVDGWEMVPRECVKVFGKRLAEEEATRREIEGLIRGGAQSVVFEARDEATDDDGGRWRVAMEQERNILDRRTRQVRKLQVIEGCVMRLTTVDSRRRWGQGQICIVESINVGEKTVRVRVAPPSSNTQVLAAQAWPQVEVRYATSHTVRGGHKTHCRRVQLPLRMSSCTTVHKLLGETVTSLCSRISAVEGRYKLWQRQQLYVVLSRVRHLRDLYLVGDRRDTLCAVRTLCLKIDEWSVYEHNLMQKLGKRSCTIQQSQMDFPIRSSDRELPARDNGVVYLLMSSTTRQTYIGTCCDLNERVKQHNSGHGAGYTKPLSRRPWEVIAYITFVTGSERENRSHRYGVELRCQHRAYGRDACRQSITTVDEALSAMSDIVEREENCRLIICGEKMNGKGNTCR